MAAPNYNVYGTIRSDIPHEISPGANQNPGGTILWNNVRIPPQGVFTIGWGANSSPRGVDGFARFNTTVRGIPVVIDIRANSNNQTANFVSITSTQPRVVEVSAGAFKPEDHPLRVDFSIRLAGTPPPALSESVEDVEEVPASSKST